MPPPRNLPLIACLALAACGGADAAPSAKVTIDTLPNGAVSVMSEGPTAWADTSGWKLVEDLRFSGEPGNVGELIQPNDIAIDEAGRMYVFDTNPAVVKVYGSDGVFLHTIGREGKGPGEFQTGFPAIFDSLLIVHDPQTARTTVFDTAGQYLRSWRASCCSWMPIYVDSEGRIATPMYSGSDSVARAFVRASVQGEVLDTVIVPELGESHGWTLTTSNTSNTFPIPLAPVTSFALLPDGGVVMGYSDAYGLIEVSDGDTVRIIGRAWNPVPIPESQRDSIRESMIEMASTRHDPAAVRNEVSESSMPTTYPAWTALMIDDEGRIWTSGGDMMDVFDRDGVYLGQVPAPSEVQGVWARSRWGRDGKLYAISTDENDLPVIVRFHVDSSAIAVH